jgi:hypothetical protein
MNVPRGNSPDVANWRSHFPIVAKLSRNTSNTGSLGKGISTMIKPSILALALILAASFIGLLMAA